MKIVIYNDENKVIEVIENISNPAIHENNAEWEGGSISGINLPFLLLDDEVICEEVTEGILALDKKAEYPKVNLKVRQSLMQKALDDLILGGML